LNSGCLWCGLLAGALCAGHAYAASEPTLFGLPTTWKNDSGYTFGIKGLYQYDDVNFSNDPADPLTGAPLFEDAHTWERKEFDAYLKAPNGLELDVGYDWQNSWTDNYLKYSSKSAGDFRIGQFLTQVGWESVEGAQTWTFLTPGLAGQAVFEDRRIGVDWSYDKIQHWTLQAAYYARGNLDGKFPGHGYSGRVVFAPVSDKTDVVHIGLAASREYPDDHLAHFYAPPEAQLTKTYLVDTKPLPFTDSIDRMGLELGFMRGPLYAQGEVLRMAAHRENGLPEFVGDGFYVFGAWMLTGESRSYKDTEFGMPKPAHKYGAFELALRYSELNLRDGIVQGGREDDWTLGLNWYLNSNLRLQANYVWAHANDSPANLYVAPVDPRVFEVRAQLYFGG
jgi:phosphate-selective porin OprO and OprP